MNNTKTFKEFAKYSSMNVLGMLGLSCYILADTFFISKGLGANGLTALNLAIPIYSLIHGSGLMLGIGGASKYSILKSQNKIEGGDKLFTNSLIFALGLSLIFFVIGLFFSSSITKILGADKEVFNMTKTYLQVILLFAPFFILNQVILCFVRNDKGPHLAMAGMLAGSLGNIILDYIFIFPLNMGIFGAVFATGLAPIISMLVVSGHFIKKKNTFHVRRTSINFSFLSDIISTGVPSLITELSAGIVIIIFNLIILKLQGNIGVAAYGVIANISLVVISIYTGIAQGIQPIISKNYGKGRFKNIQLVLKYALITMSVLSLIIYLTIFLGASHIVNIFNSEQDILLESIAVFGLKLYFTASIFAGFNIIISIYFTSAQNSRPAHFISLLRGFFIIIPMAFLLSYIGGMTGVWLVFPVTELIVSIIGIFIFVTYRRKL